MFANSSSSAAAISNAIAIAVSGALCALLGGGLERAETVTAYLMDTPLTVPAWSVAGQARVCIEARNRLAN